MPRCSAARWAGSLWKLEHLHEYEYEQSASARRIVRSAAAQLTCQGDCQHGTHGHEAGEWHSVGSLSSVKAGTVARCPARLLGYLYKHNKARIGEHGDLDEGRADEMNVSWPRSPLLGRCSPSSWHRVDADDYKLARKQVKDAPKYERDERAAHDDDIVRHAEVWSGQIDEHNGRVYPPWPSSLRLRPR